MFLDNISSRLVKDFDISLSDVNYTNFPRLLEALEHFKICIGNPDEASTTINDRTCYRLKDRSGNNAVLRHAFPVRHNNCVHESTIRSTKCHLLLSQGTARCHECIRSRKACFQYLRRSQQSLGNKFTKNSLLTTPQRLSKFSSLARKAKIQKRAIDRLKRQIQQRAEKESITVQEELCDEVGRILEEHSDEVYSTFKPGSFQRLFWEQQRTMAKCKGPTGRRWHPLLIRWAMSLKLQSSAAYRALRNSGFILMPSERTLQDYIHFHDSRAGFHSDLNDGLLSQAMPKMLREADKYVALSFDEMRVKENLVYDKNSCSVVGFVSLGEVSE